jgi:hypothetical protein
MSEGDFARPATPGASKRSLHRHHPSPDHHTHERSAEEMTITDLIRKLEEIVDQHGWNCRVEVATDDATFPLTIVLDMDREKEGKRPVVLIRAASPSCST